MAKHGSRLDRLSGESDDAAKGSFSLPDWVLPLLLVVGFVVVFLLLFGNRMIPATTVNVAAVVTIRKSADSQPGEATVTQTAGAGELLFQASGWIEPDPFPIIVPTLINGIVEKVMVLEGESVKKGQVLVEFVDDDAQIDLAEAKAGLETLKSELAVKSASIAVINSRRTGATSSTQSANSRLSELEDRLRRMESVPVGSIAKVDLESIRLQYQQQKSMVDQTRSGTSALDSELEMVNQEIKAKQSNVREAELAVERAQLALDRHTVVSPVDGIITILHVVPGSKRFIMMDDAHSAEIVEMFDPAKLQARIDVPLSEAAGLSVGQSVDLICDLLPEATLKGIVTRIDGVADIQRNTLQAKVSIKNPDSRLRPEMLVRGKFYSTATTATSSKQTSGGSRLSVFVPIEAIVAGDQVWVVGSGNRAEKRSIELGSEKRDGFQLATSGLKSGEQVILPPHNDLKQGGRVKINE